MSSINYRNLSPDDYDDIIRVWNDSGLPVKPRGRDSRENIALQIGRCPGFFIGVFDDDRLIGLVVASSDGRKGWINRLAVLPEYRGKDMAKELIRMAEKSLYDSGLNIVSCLVLNENQSSIELFRSMGYDSCQEILYLRKARGEDK